VLDVTVDRPRRLPVWRVGYRPDPWAWVDWRWATNGRFPGRWDDRDGTFRTIYIGSTLLACLLEVLADFRPDLPLVNDLADIAVDEDDETLFSTVLAGRIDPTWLDPRVAGTAALTGDFCWVTTAQTLAALHPHFVSAALRAGLKDFDAAALKDGRPRELTQSVATYLYAVTDLHGIRFASRHGDDLELWAIYERHDTAISPCLADRELTDLTTDHPALIRAFDLLGLAWVGDESPAITSARHDQLPLPLEQAEGSQAFGAVFGETPPSQATPVGAAFLWSLALEDTVANRAALESLTANSAVWGDFIPARDALAGRSIAQHPIHSADRPGEIAYVKFIDVSGAAARAFDDAPLDDVWILTMVKATSQWHVWGLTHNRVPHAAEIVDG